MASLPNILTLSRIGAIPILVALFYFEGETARFLALIVFAIAAATDFFDGYVARARKQQSQFGRFLDPIADKLLVGSVIFLLVAFDRVTGLVIIPALIILCREILVSGLREYLAGFSIPVPVSRLAKWKTTVQMLAIGFLILGDSGPNVLPITLIGEAGLTFAAVLTIITGYDYFRSALGRMGEPIRPEGEAAECTPPATRPG